LTSGLAAFACLGLAANTASAQRSPVDTWEAQLRRDLPAPTKAKKAATWLDQITIEAGGRLDIAIACDGSGIDAVSGAWSTKLSAAPALWCWADNKGGVIWFGQPGGKVSVLDLLGTGREPIEVVTGMPPLEGEPGTTRRLAVNYPDGSLTWASHNDDYSLALDLKKLAVQALEGNFYFRLGEGELETIKGAVKLTNPRLLKAIAARGQKRPLTGKSAANECPAKVKGVDPAPCESGECGSTTPIAGTKLCRVLVSQSCGDGCYIEYALYDIDKKRLLDTPAHLNPNATYLVSPSGKAVIVDGGIVSVEDGPLHTRRADGWLGAGWMSIGAR
jgi:hypothetical protein